MSGWIRGPWKIGAIVNSWADIDTVDATWWSLARVVWTVEGDEDSRGTQRARSNARLIAAAPDLAEAAEYAERLFDHIRESVETGKLMDKDAHRLAVRGRTICRAALAKAKGEKP